MPENQLDFRFSDYPAEGLYLLLPDGSRLDLTRENIERTAKKYWADPNKIPDAVKKAAKFERCVFCPLKGKDPLCDAIRPVFPFLDIIDKYVSFDEVTAIYRGREKEILHVADSKMQEALKYVSILSLMQYCQIGRTYWKYYFGIIPLARGKQVASQLYLNMYWFHDGNKAEISKLIDKFTEEIRITSQNQAQRLNLICQKDAFLNAFVNTQVAAELLRTNIDNVLAEAFAEFEKGQRS